MKQLLIALQFLTIVPLKISAKGGFASGEKAGLKDEDFGKSLLYFPLVGFLIGLLLSLSAFLLGFLPNSTKAVFVLIISIVITGGIHLDGFADTCDGFYGRRPKEKILEIMRDSHIGAMGVIGIVMLLLLKFSLIASISGYLLYRALMMMATFARWVQVLACSTSNYARNHGKAEYFIEYADEKTLFIGGLFSLGLFFLLMQLKGLGIFFVSTLCVLLFLQYIKKKIGGMTGDTIGAVSEAAEAFVLFFILILSG